MTLLIIAALVALLSSGCVSQSALNEAIDQKIAANNVTFVQPMMAQQNIRIDAVQTSIDRNRDAISKSVAQVAVHQNVMIDHYRSQQNQAAVALQVLDPEPMPVSAPAVPAPETLEVLEEIVAEAQEEPSESAEEI